MKNYESLPEALNDLKERGYLADFATDPVCLYCGEFDIRLHPQEFNVDAMFRFDESDGRKEILYAITSSTGVKGTLTDIDGSFAANLNFKSAPKFQFTQAATY